MKTKVLFIESKLQDVNFKLSDKEIAKLPKKLFLGYSIQYKDLALSVKKQLIRKNIGVKKFQQVLGCTNLYNNQLPILLVGQGRFHAINLYLQAPSVYLLEGRKIIRVSKEEIDRVRAKKKASLVRFLSADRIGILVTTKLGQENLKGAVELKKRLKKKGKEIYVFIANDLDINQFENFNIQSWVNTACSGLANDNSNIININELPN